MNSKHFVILLTAIVLISPFVNCQDSEDDQDDEDDEEYEEEAVATKPKVFAKTTLAPSKNITQTNSTNLTNSTKSTNSTNSTKASNSTNTNTTTTAPQRIVTTEIPEDEESTTRELDYVFKPVNSILQNVGTGNITGIIDMALSINTPPEVRNLVNNIMRAVFGAGQVITSSFMDRYMATAAPAKAVRNKTKNSATPAVAA